MADGGNSGRNTGGVRPTRRMPRLGDPVTVQYLGSMFDGEIVEVDGGRILVETSEGSEWFSLSRTIGRFTREGEPYFPRLLWRGEDDERR